MSECLTEQQLELLAALGADAAVDPAWPSHVDACPECRAALNECRANRAFMSRFAGALPKGGPASAASQKAGSGSNGTVLLDPLSGLTPRVDALSGYTMIREIHRGGQGVVYEAIQRSTRRTVAVKVMLDGPFASERARWRFEREVRLIAALKHPNIVVVHDSGVADGRHYFAMDYIQGRPLDEYVRVRRMETADIIRLFGSICDAVSYAHRRGVMHRDLKPSNVLVTDDGTPFVLDFGLAKVTGDEMIESQHDLVSMPGHLMGTLRYMSPEQTGGKPEEIDIRTDVYSLGVILYELLTDTPPYETIRTDITTAIRNIREVDPPRPSRLGRHVGAELEAILLKALEKSPERRYQSAGELGQDLEAWLEGRPVTAKSASSLYVLRKLAIRHWYHTTVAAALIIITIGFGTLQFHSFLTTAEARQDRDTATQNYAGLARDSRLADQGRDAVRQSLFGWFLAEWNAGRLDQARSIRFAEDSPEALAAGFLLDERQRPEELLARTPENARHIAWFVVGERATRGGYNREALDAFQRSVEAAQSAGSDPLIVPFAEARLRQLRAGTGPAGGALSETRPEP